MKMVPRNESFVAILLLPLFLLLFLLESRLILCSLNEEHLITNLTASKIHSPFSSEKTSNFSSSLDPSLSSSTTPSSPSPASLLKEPSGSNISTFSKTDSKTKHLHTLDEQGKFVFLVIFPPSSSLSFFSTFSFFLYILFLFSLHSLFFSTFSSLSFPFSSFLCAAKVIHLVFSFPFWKVCKIFETFILPSSSLFLSCSWYS